MKKTKLIATIMTICLAVCTLAYGVYAATNLSFTIGANIAFEVDNLFVDVTGRVIGAYNNASTQVALGESTLIGENTVNSINNHLVTYSGSQVVEDIEDWTIADDLYFNSSDITKKITFRIEVTNYTPNSAIRVSIAPTNAAVTSLRNNGIEGGDENAIGIADEYDGITAETAIAEYSLELTDLSTPISETNIEFDVFITKYVENVRLTIQTEVTNCTFYSCTGTITSQNSDFSYLVSRTTDDDLVLNIPSGENLIFAYSIYATPRLPLTWSSTICTKNGGVIENTFAYNYGIEAGSSATGTTNAFNFTSNTILYIVLNMEENT